MRFIISFLFFCLLIQLLPLRAAPGDGIGDSAGDTRHLKILTWNIYMLPPLIKFTGKKKRASAIADTLAYSDYDVIVFQEAFHRQCRRILRKKLKERFAYEAGPKGIKPLSLKTNSGVWILSKYPVTDIDHIKFTNKWGFDNRMSRKGALMIEFQKDGQPFQLIGTHLNSEGPAAVRLSQVKQIQDKLIMPHRREGVPIFICGDFNIDKHTPDEYNNMLSLLKAEDGPLQDALVYTCDPSKNKLCTFKRAYYDYILVHQNGCPLTHPTRKIAHLKKSWCDKYCDLSDHEAVEIEVSFKAK